MKLELSTYLAGIATAAVAIAAGFGGGMIIANHLDTDGAVPAPGMSRIERTKREEPKLSQPELAAAVETTAQAPQSDEPVINPLAEARPLRANAGVAERLPVQPQAKNQAGLQPDMPANAAALPVALQTIAAPAHSGQTIAAPGHDRRQRRARSVERSFVANEAQTRPARKRASERSRLHEPKAGPREIARYREGGVRYTIRTANGKPANPGEVEQLKRELRARREPGGTQTTALSYGNERRGVFSRIFPD